MSPKSLRPMLLALPILCGCGREPTYTPMIEVTSTYRIDFAKSTCASLGTGNSCDTTRFHLVSDYIIEFEESGRSVSPQRFSDVYLEIEQTVDSSTRPVETLRFNFYPARSDSLDPEAFYGRVYYAVRQADGGYLPDSTVGRVRSATSFAEAISTDQTIVMTYSIPRGLGDTLRFTRTAAIRFYVRKEDPLPLIYGSVERIPTPPLL